MKKLPLALLLLFTCPIVLHAQLIIPGYLHMPVPDSALIVKAVDSLLVQIQVGNVSPGIIAREDSVLTREVFNSFKGLEDDRAAHIAGFYKPQLVNCYPVAEGRYLVTLAYIGAKAGAPPALRASVQLLARVQAASVCFATPLAWYTRYWRVKRVGQVTYHYTDQVNLERAKSFDAANTRIAQKLGLQPIPLQFYLTANYQEILQLLGYVYDASDNGRYRDGYGVVEDKIFAVMHHEDFSHDLLHFYIAQIRTQPRNVSAEEGLAYAWGNAYYTDPSGKVITQARLIKYLQSWLVAHPGTDLLQLFLENPKPFFEGIAKEPSVKTTLASIVCDEIEHTQGVAGVKALVNCGRGDDRYFAVVDSLVGINKANFNVKVMALLNKR